jgi:glycerol-3-phosphate cytidylyltransferase
MKNKIYCFDLDETLCTKAIGGDYATANPLPKAIQKVNELYDSGNKILIFTGRGSSSGKDWQKLTKEQLSLWGIKHHELIMNRKPTYDIVIDDKAINAADWRKQNCGITGVVAGAFDLIHPGYCKLFKFCKENCDHLTVLLHDDPSIERKKMKPVHTLEERIEILESIRYVDKVIPYQDEIDLAQKLEIGSYNVRFLGDDYKNKNYTAEYLPIKVIYTDRSHNYSTTDLKKKIAYSYMEFVK